MRRAHDLMVFAVLSVGFSLHASGQPSVASQNLSHAQPGNPAVIAKSNAPKAGAAPRRTNQAVDVIREGWIEWPYKRDCRPAGHFAPPSVKARSVCLMV